MRLNIALVPPLVVARKLQNWSRKLAAQKDAYFVLDDKTFFSHATLYQTAFSDGAEKNITEALRHVVTKHEAMQCRFSSIISHDGWVGVYIQRTVELEALQKDIVRALSPLRDTSFDLKSHFNIAYSPTQLKNIAQFGYDAVGKEFTPHFTITRLKDAAQAEDITRQVKWEINEFFVSKIGLFVSGEHGTCTHLTLALSLEKEKGSSRLHT